MIQPSSQLGESIMQLIAAYTNFKDPLGPGVAIQRKGAVRDFFVQQGSISFEVHDKRERAFDVEIHTTVPSENVRRAVQSGAIHEAVPKVAEIQIHHVCPEWATPCRHEIAALLQLLKECEDDPNVLLKWRGIELEMNSVSESAVNEKEELTNTRKGTIEQLRKNLPDRFISLKEEHQESSLNPDMESFFSYAKEREVKGRKTRNLSVNQKISEPRVVPLDNENIYPVFEDAIETIKEFLSKN